MAAHEIVEHVEDGYTVVGLRSRDAEVEAGFVPELSMLGSSLRIAGAEILHRGDGLAGYAATRQLRGIPILHPWANRLEGDTYSAGGPSVTLARADHLVTRDRNGFPIPGLVRGPMAWREIERNANDEEARLAARFTIAPESELAARFPFPHEIEMTVRLRNQRLTVETVLRATGDQAVPISFGYHPYLRIPGERRADWLVSLPIRQRLALDERMIPTGRQETWAFPLAPLGSRSFDDAFTGIDDGARFVLQGKRLRIGVEFISGFPFAQVYAPLDRDFICFEPMTAPGNALVSGDHLRRLPAGESFRASWAVELEQV